VDNVEPVATDSALAQLAEQYEDVTYLPAGKNLGFGKGHNYVLEQLDSKYHAIVNPDIILEEDAFSKLIAFMKDDSIGMCVPRLVDEEGNLLAPEKATWITINNQAVAYYHESTVDDGEYYNITGRVPVFYNGERAELVLEFTSDDPYGSVTGVRRVYTEDETNTLAKTMDTVQDGDVIDFICDYYSYDGEYLDSYMLGEQLVVDGELEICDGYVGEEYAKLAYLFTDIYHQKYWSSPVDFQ